MNSDFSNDLLEEKLLLLHLYKNRWFSVITKFYI